MENETKNAIYDKIFGGKNISDPNRLKEIINHCKGLGLRVVLTQGTWDLIHIGHARYFKEAKKFGEILVIGIDSDEKVRSRKGPDRPIVPQEERIEMLAHLKYVDLVFLKELTHPKWHLIKTVSPDVLIATKETYSEEQIKDLKQYCGEIVILDPQATTSTSAKLRRIHINTAQKLENSLTPRLIKVIEDVVAELKGEEKKQ